MNPDIINDLHIYAHPPVFVDPGNSIQPDFQISQDALIIDNRVTTGPTATQNTFDMVQAVLTTGAGGGNELQNQNSAADVNLWLPTLQSSDAIPGVGILSPTQRVTVSYTNVDTASRVANIQTAFIGHYEDRTDMQAFPLVRPYTYYSNRLKLNPGETGQMYINIEPAYDLYVRAFFCRCPQLAALVTIQDRQYSLMNTPVFADLIAYRTFGEVNNFRMPFVPWIAQRGHRYIINVQNVGSAENQIFQFAFFGQLAEYSQRPA